MAQSLCFAGSKHESLAKRQYYRIHDSFLKHKIKKKLIFLDNLDENYLKQIKKNKNLSKSLFLIISKSGNTDETILNMYFLKNKVFNFIKF